MTAAMTCTRCRKPVITLNPSTLGASGVGDLIAEVWNDHTRDCSKTCPWCKSPKDQRCGTCGDQHCLQLQRAQKAIDRIDDVETLVARTTDPEWIARQVGLANAKTLRRWLRDQGRDDLADGPLAPELGCGIAV